MLAINTSNQNLQHTSSSVPWNAGVPHPAHRTIRMARLIAYRVCWRPSARRFGRSVLHFAYEI